MKTNKLDFIVLLLFYITFSVMLLSIQFLIMGVSVYLAFHLLSFAYGSGKIAATFPTMADIVTFAVLTILNAIAQYYLSSLLVHNVRASKKYPIEKKRLFPIIIVSAAVTSIFFYQLAARGNFSSSALASIPPVVSCFLGGMIGIVQREDKNPWKNTKIRIFKL